MISDSGSNNSIYAAYSGVFSSYLFMFSGITGMLQGKFIPSFISNTLFGIGIFFQICAIALIF